MSNDLDRASSQRVVASGFPDLTEIGRRVELLRIAKGLSKQRLARLASTSRQQLWRVMTGKSELTPTLRDRLARALGVEAAQLTSRDTGPIELAFGSAKSATRRAPADGTLQLARYLGDPRRVERAVTALPPGADGLRLKRGLLNAIEELALERSLQLPASFFDLRRRVLAGDL